MANITIQIPKINSNINNNIKKNRKYVCLIRRDESIYTFDYWNLVDQT
jgi:hypothetical protein